MTGFTFSEQAAEKIVEQVKWGTNYPRSQPQPDESTWGQTPVAFFQIAQYFSKYDPEKEYRAQGVLLAWGGDYTNGQYAAQNSITVGSSQWLYNPCGMKDDAGHALFIPHYNVGGGLYPGQVVAATFRGRWEIIPSPLRLYVTIGASSVTKCDSTTGIFTGGALTAWVNGHEVGANSGASGTSNGCSIKSLYTTGGVLGSPYFGLLSSRKYPVLDVSGWDTDNDCPIVLVDPGQQIFRATIHADNNNTTTFLATYDLTDCSGTQVDAWTWCNLNPYISGTIHVMPAGTQAFLTETYPGNFWAVMTPQNPVAYYDQADLSSNAVLLKTLGFSQPLWDNTGVVDPNRPQVGFASAEWPLMLNTSYGSTQGTLKSNGVNTTISGHTVTDGIVTS